MKPLKPGDIVILSPEGHREIPKLRRKRGVVVGPGLIPDVFVIDWGRIKQRWHNHESNIEFLSTGTSGTFQTEGNGAK